MGRYPVRIFFTLLYLLLFCAPSYQEEIIIDSKLNFSEALEGLKFPADIRKNLVLTEVTYYSFDGKLHSGQLVIHKDLEKDIQDIFSFIRENHFPVNKVIPISKYAWNDSLSIMDNNTSGFNYRYVEGTKVLSMHAKGRAIDLNPFLNPTVYLGSSPKSHRPYNPEKPGTLSRKSPVVELFIKKGWTWGGTWKSLKDYQHFQK